MSQSEEKVTSPLETLALIIQDLRVEREKLKADLAETDRRLHMERRWWYESDLKVKELEEQIKQLGGNAITNAQPKSE